MSVVTTVVYVFDGDVERYIAEIRRFEWDNRVASIGEEIDPCGYLIGGGKCAEADVRVAAYNYLPWDRFIAHLESIDWNPWDQVTVVLQSGDLLSQCVWSHDIEDED